MIQEAILSDIITNLATFKSELEVIQKIYSDLESHKTEKIKPINILVNDAIKKTSFDIRKFVKDNQELLSQNQMYSNDFAHLILSSFFTTSFSLFEVHIKKTVETADAIEPTKTLNINSIRNDILNSLLKHLSKKHGISSAKNNSDLQNLNSFRKIRNAVIHGNGKITQKDIQECLPKITAHNLTFEPTTRQIKVDQFSFLQDFHTSIIKFGLDINRDLVNNYH